MLSTGVPILFICGRLYIAWRVEMCLRRSIHGWKLQRDIFSQHAGADPEFEHRGGEEGTNRKKYTNSYTYTLISICKLEGIIFVITKALFPLVYMPI
jgi:hypothetical protein